MPHSGFLSAWLRFGAPLVEVALYRALSVPVVLSRRIASLRFARGDRAEAPCVAVVANVSCWQPSFGLSNNLATLGGIPTAFSLYDAHDNGWALDAGPSHPLPRSPPPYAEPPTLL